MPTRPNLPQGYLGPQPTFSQIGLNVFSHMDPDIVADSNEIDIKVKFRTNNPVKVTHQLINARTDEDVSQYVFTTTLFGAITFKILMPCSDYYKFQIFGAPASDEKTSMPNVYNYLIRCDQALNAVFPFPKQYAQWKEDCVLKEPLCLHKDCSLSSVPFHVNVPKANGVALVCGGSEWMHLEKKGNHWEGNFNLENFKGKKVTLNANTDPNDDSKYSTLLEYNL